MTAVKKNIFSDFKKEKYLFSFLLAFGIAAAAMLAFIIIQGGLFTYYGDFNAQQIPFYCHVHEMVRQGRFMWDFTTDLGADLMESYSFYLIGSPFFWLTVPFPTSAVPYLIPWLICLKTAVASLTAYAYIKQFSENTNACLLGALLYAFSGFQLTNIFFNHFHDATAFFPLLMLASDKLAINGKKGLFALVVAICACTNYFFFAGMAVFTVIYYIVNIICGRYQFKISSFAVYAAEALLGVACAAAILLPSASAVLENNRASATLPLSEMFIYSDDPAIYLYLLKSFFVFPDLMVQPVFEISAQLEAASQSAYLPFVSMCGVIGYFFLPDRKKDMPKAMFIITLIMMFIPVLNAAFYMFNRQYYARWFYMPILIMCVMTAVTADKDVMLFKKGLIPSAAGAVLFLAGGLIYNTAAQAKGDMTYLAVQCMIAIGSLALLYSMLTDKSLSDNTSRLSGLFKRCAVCCGLFMAAIIALGKMTYSNTPEYMEGTLKSRSHVESMVKSAQADPEQYYRVDLCEQFSNRNLMWDLSSNSSFISIVPNSIAEFYEGIGFDRGVTSHTPANYEAIRSLLSVKYYFDLPLYTDEGRREPLEKLNNAVESFDYSFDAANMHVYENNCYIPMGFTYDYYTTAKDMKDLRNMVFRSQAMLEALVLDEEQIQKWSHILSPYNTELSKYDHSRLKEISEEKAATACNYFHTDKNGFTAEISLDSTDIVFFSIPWKEGWTAQINGKPAEIEKVSYGFMAVECPEGTSVIRFDYVNKSTLYGGYISLASVSVLIIYMVITAAAKRKQAE